MNSLASQQEPNVTTRNVLIALTSVAVIAGAAGCGTSSWLSAIAWQPRTTHTSSADNAVSRFAYPAEYAVSPTEKSGS